MCFRTQQWSSFGLFPDDVIALLFNLTTARVSLQCWQWLVVGQSLFSFIWLVITNRNLRWKASLTFRLCDHGWTMATITCRVQYLEDSDPFVCTNFPEPRRPPQYDLNEHLPLNEQIAGVHKLLEAPLKVSEPHLPNKGVLLLTCAECLISVSV